MTFTAWQAAVLNPATSTTQYLTSLRTVFKKGWNAVAAFPPPRPDVSIQPVPLAVTCFLANLLW